MNNELGFKTMTEPMAVRGFVLSTIMPDYIILRVLGTSTDMILRLSLSLNLKQLHL